MTIHLDNELLYTHPGVHFATRIDSLAAELGVAISHCDPVAIQLAAVMSSLMRSERSALHGMEWNLDWGRHPSGRADYRLSIDEDGEHSRTVAQWSHEPGDSQIVADWVVREIGLTPWGDE